MADIKGRILTKIVKEIAKEENIKCTSFSYNWIFRLEKDNKVRYIFGYNFDINSSSVYQIANDKSATYDILNAAKIPAVPHIFFIEPGLISDLSNESVIENILKLGKKYDYQVVCKKNEKGTGGTDVYKAMTKSGLERIAIKLFSKTSSISLSPLMEFTGEYRCIVIDNKIKVIYEKNRQSVVGNGKSTLKELICNKYNDIDLKQIILNMDRRNAELLNEIIEEDKMIVLNWKHNLGLGAEPEIITNGDKYEKIKDLALRTSKELNIRFASIDVVEYKNKLYILEINSGVMMERFSITTKDGYKVAKEIYKEAIEKMFLS